MGRLFRFLTLFAERFSQLHLFWKGFKKWTLSSAPWILVLRLNELATNGVDVALTWLPSSAP
jgi:hypothetical protein